MPILGLPEHITSDSHSGFASNAFAIVLKMLGVQKHKLQPREVKGGVAIVEREHLPLNQALADRFATGNIVDAKSFELYVVLATVMSTQVARPGHSSPFELWCGQPGNTLSRLTVYNAKDEEMEILDTRDTKYVRQVSKQIEQLLSYEMVLRDEAARRDNLRRDNMNGQFVLATQFDLKIGDLVSYDGTKWKLIAVYGPVGTQQ